MRIHPEDQLVLFPQPKLEPRPPHQLYTYKFLARGINPRPDQIRIVENCLIPDSNGRYPSTLIVSPTSSGKTLMAILVADRMLREGKRVLFIVPTNALVGQQAREFRLHLDLPSDQIAEISGSIAGALRRSEIYSNIPKIIVSTSHSVANDISSGSFSFNGFSHIISDESQHNVGDHAHNVVVRGAIRAGIAIIGLTATPAEDYDRIKIVANNLGIDNMVYNDPSGPELSRVLQKIRHVKKEVNLMDVKLFRHIRNRVMNLALDAFSELRRTNMLFEVDEDDIEFNPYNLQEQRTGISTDIARLMTYTKLRELHSSLVEHRKKIGMGEKGTTPYAELREEDRVVARALSLHAELLFYYKILRLFETESLWAGIKNIDNTLYGASAKTRRSHDSLLADSDIMAIEGKGQKGVAFYKKRIRTNAAFMKMYRYLSNNISVLEENPKVRLFRETLSEYPDSKFIVFAKPRDQVHFLGRVAESIGVRASILLGKKGRDKGRQDKALSDFDSGVSRLLISTSAGQVGLDMEEAYVINYDQVGGAIDSSQRIGRTGRRSPGLVIDFIAHGTADEALFNRALWARKTMKRDIRRVASEYPKLRTG
jgi:ERCC4-related helicase